MLEFYKADVLGQEYNTIYPHRVEVTDEESLRRAVSCDYVCAEYRNFKRGNGSFIGSTCLAFDVDNDGTDDSAGWITPDSILDAFPGVTVAFHFSRHHMVDKLYVDDATGKVVRTVTARPRFHVFFEIDPVGSYQEYKGLKEKVMSMFPHFDRGAMDSARFFYGTEEPVVEYIQGTMTMTDYLYPPDFEAELSKIRVGSRNSTLSVFAGRVLKRLGETEEAYKRFLELNGRCDPPLEDGELHTIWNSALRFYRKVSSDPGYIPPEKYGLSEESVEPTWDEPLPLTGEELPGFPVDALPSALRDYASAVGVSTQTPVDMAAVAVLSVASACMRNNYKVEGKSDWHEPTNIYSVIIAEPSERKSAVISLASRPVDEYVREYNDAHRVDFEMSKATRQKLENRRNSLISQSRKKGEAEAAADFDDALRDAVKRLVEFEEVKPMRVYVDDTTPEKLTESLAENCGAISIISSEGGIFDVLSGAYSSKVNIDVFLKAYSGENISVDRIMRQSVTVNEACLTILLSVQPVVIGELMGNRTFRHRGLTARFLYSHPKSFVGTRSLDSETIPEKVYSSYRSLIRNLLDEKRGGKAEVIRLDAGARDVLSSYYDWVEKMLTGEFSMYSDWLGKLVGNTLRIAGIIARCSLLKRDVGDAFLEDDAPVSISRRVMEDAVRIGKYFLVHAVNAYGVMGVQSEFRNALMVLEKLKEYKKTRITRRDIMRSCRWIGTADEAQSVLGILEDYGYVRLAAVDSVDRSRNGRPKNAVYAVNPAVFG